MLDRADEQDRLAIVDGLRAIAVIAVVLFHGAPALVPGGYAGVDVFFVISGFVIGLRYLEPMAERRVGVARFFARRVWRLAPPYLVMLLACTVAAIGFLNPRDLVSYGQSLVAQAGYAQNIAYWVTGDYFIKALRKPLLHTWSLAVEEQFYFLFPLLVLAFRRSRSLAVALLVLAALGSFGVGLLVGHVSPKTAFYLLPFRVWEFVVGIGCALIFERSRDRVSPRIALIATEGGLIAILAACFAMDERSAFPGVQSLFATGGTAAICLAQGALGGPLVRVFDNRAAQYCGRISYSWYLWHWPPITFYYAVYEQPPGLAAAAALIVVGFVLGALSYGWIERRAAFRRWAKVPATSAVLLACSLPIVAVSGIAIATNDGFVGRYPADRQPLLAAQMDFESYRCPLSARLSPTGGEVCQINRTAGAGGLLIVGDSHAAQAAPLLASLGEARGVRVFLTKHNCKVIDYGMIPDCEAGQWGDVTRDVARERIDRVVVISHYPKTIDRAAFARGFERLAGLHRPLFLELSTPEGKAFDPASYLQRNAPWSERSGVSLARQRVERADQHTLFTAFAARTPGVTLMDPTPYLCGEGDCRFAYSGHPLYSDRNHLTKVGVARLRALFATVFD